MAKCYRACLGVHRRQGEQSCSPFPCPKAEHMTFKSFPKKVCPPHSKNLFKGRFFPPVPCYLMSN